jgi:hypothetical protein
MQVVWWGHLPVSVAGVSTRHENKEVCKTKKALKIKF